MNITPIEIDLPGGYKAKLIFRQYQKDGDWVCQATDELFSDLILLMSENIDAEDLKQH
jgi:hypothetical protein